MQTRAIITMVKNQAPNVARETIRTYLNEINKIVMSKPLEQNRAYDTSTGKNYKMTTVAGTEEYEVSTANSFPFDGLKVLRVYASDRTDPADATFVDGTYSNKAKILFNGDPGSNTYYVEYIKKPTEIDAETTELDIPEEHHFEIVEVLLGMVTLGDSGMSNRWNEFKRDTLPKIWSQMNGSLGYRSVSNTTSQIKPKGY